MPEAPRQPGSWDRHLPPAGPAGTKGFTPADLVADASLPARWGASWAEAPAAPLLRFVGGPARPDGHWVTAGELDERTRVAAAHLAAAGLVAGDRLVWSAAPSLDAVAACIGALRLGAAVVPVNPAYTEREVAHVVADVGPTLAVVDRPEMARWVSGADRRVVVRTPDLGPAGRASSGPAVLDAAAPGDPALVAYTSGTTGAAKGAVLTHANLLAGVNALGLAWRWVPDDRLVLALPLFHGHGLVAGLFGTLAAGASAVVLDRFGVDGVLDAAATHRATMFFGVPTMYHRLAASARVGELSGLRLCVSGSAPLAAALWQEIHRASGVAVLERYGMTETLLTISNPYEGERRPGTVGFALPGTELRVAPGADDSEAGGAGTGELWVRGPSVFSGYFGRPEATAAAFDGDWFGTGDVVSVDAEGYVAIVGRNSDLIISGGYNVYPAEVESVLLDHPDVAEAAVTGTPSPEWGEAVTAWVVPAGEAPSAEALLAFCADRLAPYKCPRVVRVVDRLPRNAMGKVLRGELR